MPKLSITTAERNEYRALAHHLKPVVLVGDQGVTEAVLKEIDTHLQAHQLIKIKINDDERSVRQASLQTICDALEAAPIHHLGKTLTIYRRNPLKPALLGSAPDDELHNPLRRGRNEPYTPKKYAAQGLKKSKSGQLHKKKRK
ncbi:MAG TPA: YhbY family RNA-binding protein [Paenalcaligenes sp.]|nr:YhbY family RNA-binding protein [Paenalcaligenes sp.]